MMAHELRYKGLYRYSEFCLFNLIERLSSNPESSSSTSNSILIDSFFSNKDNKKVVNELENVLSIKDDIQNSNNGLLNNKTFLVTGKLNGISRAEVKSLIEENSGKTISSVSKKLNFLIVGEKPTKKKVDYAKQLKIKVIDQAEFLKMLNKSS